VVTVPNVDAGVDQVICEGDVVLLDAVVDQGTVQWSHDVVDSVEFIPIVSGSYVVMSTNNSGCESTDSVYVTVVPSPEANFTFSPIQPTVENSEVTFTALSSNSSLMYQWVFGDGTTSNEKNDIVNFPEIPGEYYSINLIVVDTNGCIDSSNGQVYIADVLNYFIPNAFTPDGDQLNNMFQPVFTSGFDPSDFHMLIFNRWGEIIFESFDSAAGWNGTYVNGELVEDGLYVYSIDFGHLITDEREVVTGHVIVLK
jgi:gliding motility-associated-like protein